MEKAMSKDCRPGLDDRCRDSNGEIRHKNGATRVDTLRQTYGDSFAGHAFGADGVEVS
jgi:hypothetical protein